MAKAKQLTVSCENRPGTLAHVARALGDAKVNILSFLTTTSGAEGSVQLVVDNVNKAKKALDGAGLSYAEADVLHVELLTCPERWDTSPESWPPRRSTSRPALRRLRGARSACAG